MLRAEALLANGPRAIAAAADPEVGTLAIAASGIPGTYLLPPLLAHFHVQHPGIELDLQLTTCDACRRCHRYGFIVDTRS